MTLRDAGASRFQVGINFLKGPLWTLTSGCEGDGLSLACVPASVSVPPSPGLSSLTGLDTEEELYHLTYPISMVFPSPQKWQVNENSGVFSPQTTPSHHEGLGPRGVCPYGFAPVPPTKEAGGAESPEPGTELAPRVQNYGLKSQRLQARDAEMQESPTSRFDRPMFPGFSHPSSRVP